MSAMFSSLPSAVLPALLDAALKGAMVLTLAGVATAALPRASSAARHLIWSLAIVGLLAQPALSPALPQWRILPAWPASGPLVPTVAATVPESVAPSAPREATEPGGGPAAHDTAPAAAGSPSPAGDLRAFGGPERSWNGWLLSVWLVGAAAMLLRLGIGCAALRRTAIGARRVQRGPLHELLVACAEAMGLRRPAVLLVSRGSLMPMAWGVLKARIVLPAECDGWPADRQRAVLLHELAHVRRRDNLTHLLATIACALHWFNPLAWIARWRLTVEREQACDDAVLNSGYCAGDYAQELVEVAAHLRPGRCGLAAVAMARPSKLEGRVLAILDGAGRRVVSRRTLWLCLVNCSVGVLLVACIAAPRRGRPIPAETLMAMYTSSPDGRTAAALGDLLSYRNLPPEQGNEVLRLLTDPAVSTRDRYAASKPVYVRVEAPNPCSVSIHGFASEERVTYFIDGREASSKAPGSSCEGMSENLGQLSVGTHEGSIRVERKLWPKEGPKVRLHCNRHDWAGGQPRTVGVKKGVADRTKPPLYATQIDVPIRITVVPDAQAESVAVVTGPDTDAAVRAGMVLLPGGHGFMTGVSDGRRFAWMLAPIILIDRLPVPLVFRWELMDEAGKPWPSEQERKLVVRTPSTIMPLWEMVPRPLDQYPLGRNKATLVFTPDPEAAYAEPDIKAIWGGTLRIPVEFEVTIR